MRNRAIIAGALSLFVLQFVNGANVTPILTGAGKILFPENAVRASISASSGALTIASGGTNQNLTISPSGSGSIIGNALHLDLGTAPGSSQLKLGANSLGALQLFSFAAGTQEVLFDEDWAASVLTAKDTSVARIVKQNAKLEFLGATGQVAGNPATDSILGALDLSNGKWRFGDAAAPSYAVDSAGDVNATGVFRVGGTAGSSTTLTVVKTATGQTTCTIVFTGGLRTGGTC